MAFSCKHLTNLDYIELNLGNSTFNSNIYGDISAFVNCTNLTRFNMGFTSVTGDISVLANMPQLAGFGLNNCQNITGSIDSFANCPNLTSIGVYNTQVSGDISVLATMPNFLVLYGQNTQIYGNLSSLIGHQKLRELYVNT